MVRLVFWLFVLFLALSYLGISIRSIIESPAGQANLAYLSYLAALAWNYLMEYIHGLAQQFSAGTL